MEKLVKNIVAELINQIALAEKTEGKQKMDQLIYILLSDMVDEIVLKSLTDKPSKKNATKEELYEHAHANFKEMKQTIKDAVSDGFSSAMYKFSGLSVNYLTEIQPMTETAGKLLS